MLLKSTTPPGRDWLGTIVLAVLLIVTLLFAVLDPSCQRRGDLPAGREVRWR